MAKRIIAGILGALAAFGGLLPLGYAFEFLKEFGSGEAPVWQEVLGILLMGSVALTGMWVGVRFLFFALTRESRQSNTWMKAVLLGIGLFFPGFVFSLPITILLFARTRPAADARIALAFEVSVCVGVATTIISAILLLRRCAPRHTT